MPGYVPIFDTVFDGTLCGKWPTLPVWLTILPLADKNGVIDMTLHAISMRSGWPAQLLEQAFAELMQPDPQSRSDEMEGRRLVPLDEHRKWGWRVVNHKAYREKARLMSKDAARTASGRDAERKAAERAVVDASPAVPRCPPASPSQTQTHTQTKTKTQKKTPAAAALPAGYPEFQKFKEIYPNRAGDQRWLQAQKHANARISEGHPWEEILAGAERYRNFCMATDKLGSQYVLQAASFLGPEKPFLQPWSPPKDVAERRLDSNLDVAAEFIRRGQINGSH